MFLRAGGLAIASRALLSRRSYCEDPTSNVTNNNSSSDSSILSSNNLTLNSLKNAVQISLPKDWTYAFNSDGYIYYYNSVTGESSWERPAANEIPNLGKKARPAAGAVEVTWDTKWDGREPNKHQATHQIVLIRHGQYIHEPEIDAENKLTDLGRTQADLTGKRLRELIDSGVVLPVRSVYYSTMMRATETGQQITPHIPDGATIEPCSMIREGAVCRPIPPSAAWKVTDEEFDKEGIRALAAFKNHFHRAEANEEKSYSTVLVCHGNLIRYCVMKALQLPPEAWLRTAVYNASITIIEIRPNGNVSLRMMGDCGHLPADMITYM